MDLIILLMAVTLAADGDIKIILSKRKTARCFLDRAFSNLF